MNRIVSIFVWLGVSFLGAASYIIVAFRRSEPINAGWVLAAALCTYAIGYRFYSKWIAARLLTLDNRRATPCETCEDGRDFVKTNKWVVFGHHFAAISGPGPLVGPVLAAQFGYLPGTLWILIGVVLGGAVQDFIILFSSMRRKGKSLGEMVKDEIGTFAGIIALIAIVCIITILIAVLGLIVVKALAESPWGVFTIAATIPIALFMGCYMRYLRVGKVLEITVIGVVLLLLSVWGGKFIHDSPNLAPIFTLKGTTLAWAIIIYGLAASILPVWLLLAPRDYLSTFMKLGTIGALAIGIFLVLPIMNMPALTQFINGTGPIFAGDIFPFCFITIACGAISGFHTLIASGTTPKIIGREEHARAVGYGSMLLESFVAIMAMIAACTLQPGTYFAINSSPAVGTTPDAIVSKVNGWGFSVTADEMSQLAVNLGEKTMFGRTGGAPTLAVGMAHIFAQVIGGNAFMALWYHFAIMFEALFILTTIDAGTRVGRFLIQAFLGHVWKPLGDINSYPANIFSSALLVSAWGYFLYQGVIDPLGGINSLWPMFGIANQLLSVIALCLATTILIKMHRKRYLFVTIVPMIWLVCVTFTAGLEKIFHSSPKIGFLAQAADLQSKLQSGSVDVAKVSQTKQLIFNAYLNATISGIFITLVAAILVASLVRWLQLVKGIVKHPLAEEPAVWLPEAVIAERKGVFSGWFGLVFFGLTLSKQLTGQTDFENLTINKAKMDCSCHPSDGKSQNWAEFQEKRFSNPRCC